MKRPNPELADGMRYVYCRVTINGIPKDISTKRIWHPSKWSVGAGRATGNKEDTKTLNAYLDTLTSKIY